LLHQFENLVVHSQCDLDFDGLGYLIRKVPMVNLVYNKEDWKKVRVHLNTFPKSIFVLT
jgi:hypothetical protein